MSPNKLTYPLGWIGHIPFVFWLIEELRPSLVVELGTHSGNSYFAMCQAVQANNLDTKCYAVDTWLGDEHAHFYSEDVFQDVSNYNNSNYVHFSSLMRMTFDEALSYFGDGSIDLLHIDGLHTYEAVKHDFQSWLPKVSSRGVVIMHDISVRERNFGVWKLWEELKDQYPSFEFRHSHGLGVLFTGTESAYILNERLYQEDVPVVLDIFMRLGKYLEEKNSLIGEKNALNEEKNALAQQIKDLQRQLYGRQYRLKYILYKLLSACPFIWGRLRAGFETKRAKYELLLKNLG